MKKLIILLLLSSFHAFAASFQDLIWDHPNNNYLLNLYNTKPEVFKNIDEKDNLLHPITNERLDLFMSDLIDQVESTKESELLKSALEKLGKAPLENYPLFFNELIQLAKANEKTFKLLHKIPLTQYTKEGYAQIHKLRIHKKGSGRRLVQNQRIANYNKLLAHPDSIHIQRYLRRLFRDQTTDRFTVAKLKTTKKRTIKKEIKNYKKITYDALLRREARDAEKYKTKKEFTIIEKKVKKKIEVYVTNRKNKKALKTAQLFELIQKSVNKQTFLQAFHSSKENEGLHVLTLGKSTVPLLTPSYLYANIDQYQKVFKEVQVRDLISKEDDYYLLKIRKWISNNRIDFKKDTQLSFESRLPSRSLVLDNAELILKTYPNNPWDKTDIVYKQNGKEIKLGQKGSLKFLKGLWETVKPLTRLESLAGNTAGIGAFLLSGGNPYLATMTRSLVYHSVYAKRYGKNYLKHMKENLPKSMISSAVLASGFFPGALPHAIIMGGISGSIQSAVTGTDMKVGFIVGGIQEGLLSFLPEGVNNLVVDGMNKNFENAVIEILQTATKTGVRGFFIGAIDNGDALKGMKDGALYGVAEAGAKIYIMGYRYNVIEANGITQEEIDHFLEHEHNPVLRDRVYGGEDIYFTIADMKEVVFRKDAPFRETFLYKLFFGGSYELGGQSSLSAYHQTQNDTIIHEAAHYAQEKRFGFLSLVYKYLESLVKYGTSIYEDYVFL